MATSCCQVSINRFARVRSSYIETIPCPMPTRLLSTCSLLRDRLGGTNTCVRLPTDSRKVSLSLQGTLTRKEKGASTRKQALTRRGNDKKCLKTSVSLSLLRLKRETFTLGKQAIQSNKFCDEEFWKNRSPHPEKSVVIAVVM